MEPLLSILVVVYNTEKYLERCLNSILKQDFDNYEIIIVDNGSEDKSASICDRYYHTYADKIKFFKLEKPSIQGRGHIKARKEAKGSYLQLIDSDDFIEPGSLKKIANLLLNQKPDTLIINYNTSVEKGAKNLIDTKLREDKVNGKTTDEVLDYISNIYGFQTMSWRFILSKNFYDNCILKYKKIETEYKVSTNDWLNVTKFLVNSKKIYYISEPLYCYTRRESGAQTSENSTNSARNYFVTFVLLMDLLEGIEKGSSSYTFILLRAKIVLELFVVLQDFLKYRDFVFMQNMIRKYKHIIKVLQKNESEEFRGLASFLEDNKYNIGLMSYLKFKKISFMADISEKYYDNIFIMPSGIKGESTARLLKKLGIRLKGFLDNDTNKQEQLIEGIKCYNPEDVFSTDAANDKVLIIVASLYEELDKILIHQLKNSCKIKSENIITRR